MDELPNCPLCGSKLERHRDEYGPELYIPMVSCSRFGCPNWDVYVTEAEWTAAAQAGRKENNDG
jgi:hypothetical protein